MNSKKESEHRQCHGRSGRRKGPSSFWMHDPEVVFNELKLKGGDVFLDLGCGPGEYTVEAARIIGNSGLAYALDKWQYLLDGLKEEAASEGLENIRVMAADITGKLDIEDSCIDVCLLSTVLHIFKLSEIENTVFTEIRRVLKPDGRVAIIECKKEDRPFGPPKYMCISHEEMESSVIKYGFRTAGIRDLGYNYMIQFVIEPFKPPNAHS